MVKNIMCSCAAAVVRTAITSSKKSQFESCCTSSVYLPRAAWPFSDQPFTVSHPHPVARDAADSQLPRQPPAPRPLPAVLCANPLPPGAGAPHALTRCLLHQSRLVTVFCTVHLSHPSSDQVGHSLLYCTPVTSFIRPGRSVFCIPVMPLISPGRSQSFVLYTCHIRHQTR